MQLISPAVFGPLQDSGTIILHYHELEASINNFDTLMQKPLERGPVSPTDPGPLRQIRFEEVVFRHKTAGINSIGGISFEANRGETIAFAGPSGSGKSTLVKLLAGLYRPVAGAILFNDVPAAEIRYNQLRRKIGLVTQETQLFAGTIRENMLFVKGEATDEEIIDALEKASCNGLLTRSEKGIHTLLGEGGLQLSGGEKQRIAIARALRRNPQLLI